jgi:hypothetical protein
MSYRRPVIGLLLLLLGGFAATAAPDEEPRDAVAELIDSPPAESRAWEKLAWLTDRIGHRLSGSKQLEEAVDWAVAQWRRDGLERVWTEEVAVPHWIRGEGFARIVHPATQDLALLALGGSVPTPETGITAEVLRVRDFDELRAAGERARGRIVLYDKPIQAGFRTADGYGSAAGLRVDGAIEAARLGAVGTLVRSLGTADFRLPHTGMMRYEEGVPRIPSAAIAAEDADLIRRLLDAGDPVRVQLELGCRNLPDAVSANVVADLPGGEKADEIVLIACHLDSWDVGTGAIDDGAGCAIVMETMRLLRGLERPPRRTVRAVLFTSEEFGAQGARAYVEEHEAEMPLHVAAIEADMGGEAPLGFGVSAGPGGIEIVRELAGRLSPLEAERVIEGGGGADISALRPHGVPLLALIQESSHYFDYHHSPADTLDKIDRADLDRATSALAVMTWLLAESDSNLPRLPVD